ncbi:hypothetical protein BH11MYX2_BH11MYX2_22100 [soil metagenome]
MSCSNRMDCQSPTNIVDAASIKPPAAASAPI